MGPAWDWWICAVDVGGEETDGEERVSETSVEVFLDTVKISINNDS